MKLKLMTIQLFVQQVIQANNKENIRDPVAGHLW